MKVICIMGPTGSGKTQLALELAAQLNGEIISVDSALIYRGMDIGTAKPSLEEQRAFPHHLIDICDPSEIFSAGEFCRQALRAIENILAQHKIPIMVGGTMLYFHRLQNGLTELPTANAEIREKIKIEADQLGWAHIHQQLKKVDPQSAARIHPNDAQRIQRALEIYQLTGKPIGEHHQQETQSELPYSFINFSIIPSDRDWLQQRIEKRFDQMLEQGLIEEVKKLWSRGDLHEDLPSIRSVNYRQVWKYLNHEYDYAVMREKAIIATRQLAKHQLTWLKNWKNSQVIAAEEPCLLKTILKKLQID